MPYLMPGSSKTAPNALSQATQRLMPFPAESSFSAGPRLLSQLLTSPV